MDEITEQIDLVFQGLGCSGSIYISNYSAVKSLQTLRRYEIKAVVTAARGLLLPHSKQELPNYLYLPIDDTEEQQIMKYFSTTFQFIQKNRKRGNILVHCFSGISRSAAIIIAYLVKKYGYKVSQSLELLRRKKKRIRPNHFFMKQLQSYYRDQRGNLNKLQSHLREKSMNCSKKELLAVQLKNLKIQSESIQKSILDAQQKIMASQRRKRSTSQYLRQKLMEKSLNSSRKGSEYQPSQRNKNICANVVNKISMC